VEKRQYASPLGRALPFFEEISMIFFVKKSTDIAANLFAIAAYII
jgi:hypothetical protein